MDLKDRSERSDRNDTNSHTFYNNSSGIGLGNRTFTNNHDNQNKNENSHNMNVFNEIGGVIPQSIADKEDEINVEDGNVKRNIFIEIPRLNERYENNPKNIIEKPNNTISQSSIRFSPKHLKAHYVSCSRDAPNASGNYERKINFHEDNTAGTSPHVRHNVNENNCSEKATYCRPVHNLYNQEFVYKTMARNARLQRLVKKLVMARQRERQNEEWNNYINELKNKHGYYNGEPRRISTQYAPDEFMRPELIDDYYNTKFRWNQSNPCQNLLEDFYGDLNFIQPNARFKSQFNYDYEDRQPRPNYPQYFYRNNQFCYPSSSQGRLLVLNRERERNQFANQWRYRPSDRYVPGNNHVLDKHYNRQSKSKQSFRKIQDSKSPLVAMEMNQNRTKNSAMQTDFKIQRLLNDGDAEEDNHGFNIKDHTFKQQYDEVTKNVERLKKKIHKSHNDIKEVSLTNIENKLNELIKSINTYVGEIKAKNTTLRSIDNRKSTSVSRRLSNNYIDRLNMTKSDTFGLLKPKKFICGIPQNLANDSVGFSNNGSSGKDHLNHSSRIEKILYGEMKKSKKVKRDIEDIINKQTDRPCTVQITFDIPTKERSTEVTHSLSKTKINSEEDQTVVEEIDNSDPTADVNDGRMTIAVNTDPLGLLALLRISTETIKQILSFMPNIDYISYLSMLQFPQLSNSGGPHYVCNICGAAFGRPSQLSDHIQNHNLGNSRDCCVCRHALDTPDRRLGLFACRYCGHRFTRAYCCELHQGTCARRLGVRHDVTPSLMLLR